MGSLRCIDQLNHYFRRLYLTENHHEVFDNIGEVVNTFVKQGYLDKVKLASADTSRSSDKDHYEYYCGPRAKVEIKESNMIGFIQRVRDLRLQHITVLACD